MSRFSRDAVEALAASGYAVRVVTLSAQGALQRTDGEIRIRWLSWPRHFRFYPFSCLLFFLYGLRECLRRRPCAVFANTWSIAGVAGYLLGKLLRVPYFVFAHGLDIRSALPSRKALWLMRRVCRGASAVLVNSRYTQALVADSAGVRESRIVRPVVQAERFGVSAAANPRRIPDKRVILTVARLSGSKNHAAVLGVLPDLLKEYPDLVYRIVGSGEQEAALRDMAAEMGVAGSVIFEGEVSEADLPLYYQACELFVLVSKEFTAQTGVEGFGIVFLEAAASARPVVASRSGGISDAVADGETGILVDPDHPAALKNAIVRLLTDREYARRLGEAGRRRVEQEFSPVRLQDDLAALLGDRER